MLHDWADTWTVLAGWYLNEGRVCLAICSMRKRRSIIIIIISNSSSIIAALYPSEVGDLTADGG